MALRTSLRRVVIVTVVVIGAASSARADIFQWEYTNAADPSQGKRQSTTLAPDGAGVDAAPGANLVGRNLTRAYLIGANFFAGYPFSPFGFDLSNFAGSNLSRADLTNANLHGTTLTNADFTDAEVRGTRFDVITYQCGAVCFPGLTGVPFGTGITPDQLYSTASYKVHDLTGIGLSLHDLTGADFEEQNLSDANFYGANLTGANFRDADLANTYFEANLTSANLRGANLANAHFAYDFPCYSCYHAALPGADLTAADVRGAIGLNTFGATTTNLILPDGHISGVDLDADGLLVIRDHDGGRYAEPPIPVTVDQHLTMGRGGTLRTVFEADAWDSTISFAPGIPVTLGATLELTFAADVNLASQIGRVFNLFDWTGVTATGAFAISSPYIWDVSNLYTTGEITLMAIPEPVTFLLATAALGVLVRHRRRCSYQRFLMVEIPALTCPREQI